MRRGGGGTCVRGDCGGGDAGGGGADEGTAIQGAAFQEGRKVFFSEEKKQKTFDSLKELRELFGYSGDA
jgi:hypothetical protein